MRYPQQAGFTLIETLVSITILLIVITGPLAITSNSAKSSSFSSEQVTAFFLAQEGIELVEKARDDLLVPYFPGASQNNPDPWADFTRTSNAGTYKYCYSVTGCDLTITPSDNKTVSVTNCQVNSCQLNLDTTTANLRSRYTHGNGTATPFTRVITLEQVNPNEVKVTSKVTWRTGSIRSSQDVTIESRLFNLYGS